MEISLAPEKLFTLGSIQVTNALFTSIIVFVIILLFSIYLRIRLSYRNPGKLQLLVEMIVEQLYGLVGDVIEKKYAQKLIGFLMSFFVLILVSNWFGLLPIVPALSLEKSENHEEKVVNTEEHSNGDQASDVLGEEASLSDQVEEEEAHDEEFALAETDSHEQEQNIVDCIKTKHCYLSTEGVKEFHESVHVLRAPTSDLSMAIALALISVIVTNYLGFRYGGMGYLKKYINFSSPINAFVGLLEIVSEIGKLVSFSFRLFGNVFAGEILLVVITSISFGIATLPFLLLEIFVGAIQAFVFFMLTSVFIGLALSHHHDH